LQGEIHKALKDKLAEALARAVPAMTRREIRVPQVAGQAVAVIGMRRSGKSRFLWQCLADMLDAGVPREALVYINFEDERLAGMEAADLAFLLEEYYRLQPAFRDQTQVTWFLDAIPLVAGWESFAGRVLESEKVRLFLSGSSASLLSRKVATGMRGRAMEVVVYPFSFRESLLHRKLLPVKEWALLPKARRSLLQKAFHDYLVEGGFPAAQGIDMRDRRALLQSYVDVAVLRDIIERHAISNPAALRWLQRHLLGNPAAPFSIQKSYDAMRAQGIAIAKDSLHAFLAHFEDAFLVHNLSLFTGSERQRMVNPRKAYPIDPGLIQVYARSDRKTLDLALETAVLIELLRRGYELHYLRTPHDHEVDFHAHDPHGDSLLIQVCADASTPATPLRAIRSLLEAGTLHPKAKLVLLSLETLPPGVPIPASIKVIPAIQWFLQPPEH
jgi:hypothetical protein